MRAKIHLNSLKSNHCSSD